MINITLRQLRYFEALARHGHFAHAAQACAISQPAMSIQIRLMEETLGAKLVEREARQIRLTRLGEELRPRVQAILRAVDELGDVARIAGGDLAGRLRLGVIPTIAPYLLPGIITKLTQLYPALDLHVRETLTPRLLQELAEGRIDAAILALPVSEPALSEIALFSEKFVLVRPQAQAQLPMPDRAALREMRLLLLEEGHCFRDQALSFCEISAAHPREGLDASTLSTLVQMVGAGMGVTLLPEMALGVETRAAAVSIARFEGAEPARTIGMVWRKTNPLARQLVQIGTVVQAAGEALRQR